MILNSRLLYQSPCDANTSFAACRPLPLQLIRLGASNMLNLKPELLYSALILGVA